MSGCSEAVLNASFRSPGRWGFNLKSMSFNARTCTDVWGGGCSALGSVLPLGLQRHPALVGIGGKAFPAEGLFQLIWLQEERPRRVHDLTHLHTHTQMHMHASARALLPLGRAVSHTTVVGCLTSSSLIPVFCRKTNPTSVKALFSSRLNMCSSSSVTSVRARP